MGHGAGRGAGLSRGGTQRWDTARVWRLAWAGSRERGAALGPGSGAWLGKRRWERGGRVKAFCCISCSRIGEIVTFQQF
ncbi:hypothetical protein J7E73_23080 [Paenibacillus albidus]|uniref:hypothetical protein n=1 Tax=Paenibacillus albidus TaxID=2041023 RepID=UPI001BE85443|nr:hypothetical protein [Paenibacillus albidus]MBT2291960.1 hypothetical protein [Paenibacillus albidus]